MGALNLAPLPQISLKIGFVYYVFALSQMLFLYSPTIVWLLKAISIALCAGITKNSLDHMPGQVFSSKNIAY